MLYASIKNTLSEVTGLLSQLKRQEYIEPCRELSDSTIGQHTRHIIEMFQCLINNYDLATVNYDSRPRDKKIETEIDHAIACIKNIVSSLQKEDKPFALLQNIAGNDVQIASTYNRELLYNLEHCIHHQALIKVAVLNNNRIFVSENFGIAPSTVEFRKVCVQ